MIYLLIFLLVLAALFLFRKAAGQQDSAGLPAGRVIYSDTQDWGKPVQPFLDLEIGLTGKPDYLVQQDGFTVPVEVKSTWAPPHPYESHIFQLAAYCLLIEKTSGTRPPYGILKYHNRSFAIDYTSQLKSELLELLDEMRYKLKNNTLNRSHQQSARCARCSYRFICDQRL